jgi:hypothetical protein
MDRMTVQTRIIIRIFLHFFKTKQSDPCPKELEQ